MTLDLTTPEVCNGIGSEIYNRIQFEDLRPWLDSNISDNEYKLKFKAEKSLAALSEMAASMGYDTARAPHDERHTGETPDVSDSAAGEVAAAVGAEKVVFVSDTHGILRELSDPESRISSLNESQIKEMIEEGIIGEKMFPKVEACMAALEGGVKKAHIIDGRLEHSLLLEIYTDKGVGTQIVKN